MYTPTVFAENDPATLHAIMRENGFALLVSGAADGPTASHLPIVLETGRDGAATLVGHMAKANPHWQALEADPRAMVVFSGPHAYVSPSWYASGPAVPTWNYVAVHAFGRARIIESASALLEMMERLVKIYEGDRKRPWQIDSLPEDYKDGKLKGIVGFEIPVDRLEGKLKLSQNQPKGDVERVARAIENDGKPGARQAAAAMRRARDSGN